MFNKKRNCLKILREYSEIVSANNVLFPIDYYDNHKVEIDLLAWLLSYYKAYSYKKSTQLAKEYLEQLIKYSSYDYYLYSITIENFKITPLTELEMRTKIMREINFLYNWIYKNKIVGF